MYGYMGKILKIDLSRQKVAIKEFEEGFARTYLGGTGFGAKLLWDLTTGDTDPLAPENPLIFATGPTTGTVYPSSGRYVAIAKSPLTGCWGEAHCGGRWGPLFKAAGYDAAVILGRAPKPVYISIIDDEITFHSAEALWGSNVVEMTDHIKDNLGKEVEVNGIGPAGENLVKFACIMSGYWRAAGRTGMGAVMGSKNLKAIAVDGSKTIEAADLDQFLDAAREAVRKLTTGRWREFHEETLGKFGTPSLVSAINEIGRLPTKNHQTGFYEQAELIDEHMLRDNYRISRDSCFGCAIMCKYLSGVQAGKYRCTTGGPEYESVMAYGSNCDNSDIESIIYVNYLCNLYGLDTISAGCVVAFAIECYERGLLTRAHTDLELKWGNDEAIVELTRRIANRKGLGDLLAEGSRLAAQEIGGDAPRYAIHVKGLELSGQDGRAQFSVAITHGSNVRGADHLRNLSCLEELGFPEVSAQRFGEDKVEGIQTLRSPDHKPLVVVDMELLYAIVDSLLTCKYGVMWAPALYFNDFAKALVPLTGIEAFGDIKYLRKPAHRICALRKAYNVRVGHTKKDDDLPARFYKDRMVGGPTDGADLPENVYWDMMAKYYQTMGYDPETSHPRKGTLEELGLDFVVKELQNLPQ
ncbi:MAG: aldehyde ferredoxin oxidoreductase family protein [Candidatus Heimdallarchaeota archaeon]